MVMEIHENDVLCGRGAPSNWHAGNQYFRRLVNEFQPSYLAARRADKPELAMRIVGMIRQRGGRFLKRTKRQGLGPSGHFQWQDIGEQRAYEKACQALREGAPEIRRRTMIASSTAAIAAAAAPPSSSGSKYKTPPASKHDQEDQDKNTSGPGAGVVVGGRSDGFTAGGDDVNSAIIIQNESEDEPWGSASRKDVSRGHRYRSPSSSEIHDDE